MVYIHARVCEWSARREAPSVRWAGGEACMRGANTRLFVLITGMLREEAMVYTVVVLRMPRG